MQLSGACDWGKMEVVMDKKLVSIIVPIYNGENYINNVYYNVLSQTYRPIELILINDGSTDRSEELLSIISKNHNRATLLKLVVCEKNNGGIASARNAGLEKASGEYIMFMDQDDRMEPDCVERLMDEAVESDAELVISGVNKVNGKGEKIESWSLKPQLSWSKFRITAPWGRVFKKSIIVENELSFFNTKISEDLYFNILFLSYANNVKVISYIGYNWLQNQSSESHGNWSKMSDDRNPLIMLMELHKRIGNSHLLKKEEMTFFFTKYLVWYLLFCSRGATHNQVKERSKEIFAWLKSYYADFTQYAWKSLWLPKGEQLKIRLCVALVLVMWRLKLLPLFLEFYRRI